MHKPVAMRGINFQFDFDLNPEGLLEVFLAETANRLLLDYSMEDDAQMLDIVVEGEQWARVQY